MKKIKRVILVSAAAFAYSTIFSVLPTQSARGADGADDTETGNGAVTATGGDGTDGGDGGNATATASGTSTSQSALLPPAEPAVN